MWETGETRETGEDFDLFRRRMPAFNGTELNSVTALRSKLERRIKNNILTGLTGLADRTPRLIEWLPVARNTKVGTVPLRVCGPD
jgi:hypothetical protein